MKVIVKLLVVAEIQTESGDGVALAQADQRLDAFREATLPSENHGITLYRATSEDLRMGLRHGLVMVPPLDAEDKG